MIIPNDGDGISFDRGAGPRFRPARHIEHLPSGAGLGDHLVFRHHKTAPIARRDQELAPRDMLEQPSNIVIVAQIDHKTHRLTMAAPTGQLVAADGIEPAVGAEQHDLVGGFRVEQEAVAIALLEFHR